MTPPVPVAGTITVEDPRSADVEALLGRHLAFTTSVSPPEDMHALGVDGLLDPAVTFYCYRVDGTLLGVGALKELGGGEGEIKSMHTAAEARRSGVAATLVDHIMRQARARGLQRLNLETGSMAEFLPARSLYARAGFTCCEPFAGYRLSPNSVFMTLALDE